MDTPAWARQLAQRRTAHHAAPGAGADKEDWTPEAVTLLWALFDRAVEQANAALERAGATQRVLLHRTMREYRLSMAGPEGEERQIAAFASLTLVGGQPSGGALITTTTTRATIWLIASWSGRRMRWVVSPGETEFTGRVVGDLFLSVFGDDPGATTRLSPYFTLNP